MRYAVGDRANLAENLFSCCYINLVDVEKLPAEKSHLMGENFKQIN